MSLNPIQTRLTSYMYCQCVNVIDAPLGNAEIGERL